MSNYQSKGNQAIKFGQVIRYNKIKFGQVIRYNKIKFFFRNREESEVRRLVPGLFLFFFNLVYNKNKLQNFTLYIHKYARI